MPLNKNILSTVQRLARQGLRPRLIYEEMGRLVSIDYITNCVCELRAEDPTIPIFPSGRLPGPDYHLPRVYRRKKSDVSS